MLTNDVSNHNNQHTNGTNGRRLECSSDYEECPQIDVIPTAPTAQWRNEFPRFTHNLVWQDSSGISHSLTLRSDSLQDLLGDLKLVKSMIKAAKEQHRTANPTQPVTQEEKVVCKLHSVQMERRVSKRTGGHYHSHKLAGRDLCFGTAKS